ncbi:hypothetical protein HD597_003007 [Nonomuraea thailandensis]|uniref:Uncharacterized protein n=1 Tax=Nonomuraea thailandensis TaxID=1188745 RepID=A0A9X2K058_9ACTN|nr:hypothetical protein [Nonomuraea thailandensis]MCP2355987.1 hypothetical protein [Nonomuraea thailandensis]
MRRALKAGATIRRNLRWSAPYAVSMLCTSIHRASGQVRFVRWKSG